MPNGMVIRIGTAVTVHSRHNAPGAPDETCGEAARVSDAGYYVFPQ